MERKCCAGGENNSSERGGGALSVDQAFLGAKRLRLLTRQTKGSVSQLNRKFSRSRAAKACRGARATKRRERPSNRVGGQLRIFAALARRRKSEPAHSRPRCKRAKE